MSLPAEIDEYSTAFSSWAFLQWAWDFFIPQASCSALTNTRHVYSGLYSHAIQNINSNVIQEVHGPGIYFVLIACFNQRASLSAGSLNQSGKCRTHPTSLYSLTFYSNEKRNKESLKFWPLYLLCVFFSQNGIVQILTWHVGHGQYPFHFRIRQQCKAHRTVRLFRLGNASKLYLLC